MTTITFENDGQAFLEWDLDDRNVVVACRPGMDTIWLGTVVLTRPIASGRTIEVSLKGTSGIRRMIHRVRSVESAREQVTQTPNMNSNTQNPEPTTATPTLTKRDLRKAAALLARHVRAAETAKAHFLRSRELLNQVVAAGVPLSVPIVLRNGRTVVLRDRFADKNEAFAPKLFHRFQVEEYKKPREVKVAPVEA